MSQRNLSLPLSIQRLLLWGALIWLALLAALYYSIRTPFIGDALTALSGNIIDLIAIIMLVTLAGAMGFRAAPEMAFLSLPEQIAVQALFGLGAISLGMLIAGMLEMFPPAWLVWAINGIGLLILWRSALGWLRAVRGSIGIAISPSGPPGSILFNRLVMIGALVLLALTLSLSFAPPTQWDGMSYHLVIPQVFLREGRVIGVPENHYFGFPMIVEMLFTWLMIIARPQAAVLVHSAFGLLMVLMVVGAAHRLGRPSAGWLAVATLLLGVEVWNLFHYPYTDLGLAAFIMAAFCLISAQGRITAWRALAAGIMAGLAMGTKYTSIGPVAGLGLLALWRTRIDGPAQMIRTAALIGGAAAVVFAPWAIRNVLLLGNLVAPFVWGTSGFDRLEADSYLGHGTGLKARALLAPLESTILGGSLFNVAFGASAGPLLIGLLPLALIGWRGRRQPERDFFIYTVVFALPAYALWQYGIWVSYFLISIRLIYPLAPMLALSGALGMEGLADFDLPVRADRLARVLVIGMLAASVAYMGMNVMGHASALKVSVGLMPTEDYLDEALPAYYTATQHLNRLPPESRILLLWETRTYGCQRICVPDEVYSNWHNDLARSGGNVDALLKRWREQGYTHLLINEAALNSIIKETVDVRPLPQSEIDLLDGLREDGLTLIWDGADAYDAYSLYRLSPDGAHLEDPGMIERSVRKALAVSKTQGSMPKISSQIKTPSHPACSAW